MKTKGIFLSLYVFIYFLCISFIYLFQDKKTNLIVDVDCARYPEAHSIPEDGCFVEEAMENQWRYRKFRHSEPYENGQYTEQVHYFLVIISILFFNIYVFKKYILRGYHE